MGILHSIKRAMARLVGDGTVVGGGAMGAGLDISQVEAVQREEFEPDEHPEEERE